MSNSILTTIKKLSGVEDDYDHFDTDIVVAINTAFMALSQMGVGPKGGFSIVGEAETWDDYFKGTPNLEPVKSYLALKVKLLFDPPASSYLIEAMERQASEIEWRLTVAVGMGDVV